MRNMRFKVGDRVRIKSIDWYNENKDDYGSIYAGNGFCFWKNMARLCGEIMKITSVKVDPEDSNKGYYFMENSEEKWTDEMIECKVEEETKPKFKVGDRVITNKGYIGKFEGWISDYQVRVLFEESGCNVVIHPKDLKLMEEETKPNIIEEAKTYWDSIKDAWICPDGYIFKDENGNVINAQKIVLEKKKKEYPKTFEECVHVLEGEMRTSLEQMNTFRRLIDARNAYWKIAGEEMGLGKPWEPDWDNLSTNHEFIKINKGCFTYSSRVLVFPTEEMRDAFKGNFDPDIEICKEFL